MSNKKKLKTNGFDRFNPMMKKNIVSSKVNGGKIYINGYDKNHLPIHLNHITYMSNFHKILNEGLKAYKEGCVWLFEDGEFYEPRTRRYIPVRDYIGYNQIYLKENEDAVVFTFDVSEYDDAGLIMGEKVCEISQDFHRVIRGGIPANKIISYEFVQGIDHLKTVRPSNNKDQKWRRKQKPNVSFQRTLYSLNNTEAA